MLLELYVSVTLHFTACNSEFAECRMRKVRASYVLIKQEKWLSELKREKKPMWVGYLLYIKKISLTSYSCLSFCVKLVNPK